MYFTGLKTAGKNFGLWKTAYILYFPDYNPHHRQPAPLFFLSQKETKVNRLPAPPYNPIPPFMHDNVHDNKIEQVKYMKDVGSIQTFVSQIVRPI